jgi:hypothetical protein
MRLVEFLAGARPTAQDREQSRRKETEMTDDDQRTPLQKLLEVTGEISAMGQRCSDDDTATLIHVARLMADAAELWHRFAQASNDRLVCDSLEDQFRP